MIQMGRSCHCSFLVRNWPQRRDIEIVVCLRRKELQDHRYRLKKVLRNIVFSRLLSRKKFFVDTINKTNFLSLIEVQKCLLLLSPTMSIGFQVLSDP